MYSKKKEAASQLSYISNVDKDKPKSNMRNRYKKDIGEIKFEDK